MGSWRRAELKGCFQVFFLDMACASGSGDDTGLAPVGTAPASALVTLSLLVFGAACGSGSSSGNGPSVLPTPLQPAPATYTLSGTVRDGGNDNPREHVRVDMVSDTLAMSLDTGFSGTFSFSGLRGTVTLRALAAGYASSSTAIEMSANKSMDLALRRIVGRSVPCGDAPDTGNRVLPLFSRPFAGEFPLTNYFDHDVPFAFQDANGYQLTACDDRISTIGRVDGHSGYDWLLPMGTTLLSTVDGVVTFAGTDPPFPCPSLGKTVFDQRVVSIRSDGASIFDAQYVHLSRLDVTPGQRVIRGQPIGLSGNTGCSTEPHLHFQVRGIGGQSSGALVDPYGWEGNRPDPWAQRSEGRASIWLWRPSEAPRLRLR